MKNFIKSIICCFVAVTLFVCTSCSNKSEETPDSDDIPTVNTDYYASLGYHIIEFDDNIKIICNDENKVVVTDTKIMIPNNTNITIDFNLNNSDFVYNNGNCVNFKTGKILTSYQVNTKTINLENSTIKVKDDLTISANFSNFKTIGVATYAVITEDEEYYKFVNNEFSKDEILAYKNNELATSLNNFLFAYSETATSAVDFANNNIKFNTTFKSETDLLADNKFKLKISLEVFLETTKVFAYMILKDELNNIHLFEVNTNENFLTNSIIIDGLANENSNLDSIEIKFTHDLTFSEVY